MANRRSETLHKNTKKPQAQGAPVPAIVALVCAVALVAGLLSGFAGGAADGVDAPLRLSEVMTSNGSTIVLADGEMPDWIEIENVSDAPVDLTGWALVNQAKPSNAFAFPGGTLGAGERVVVYCDNVRKSLVNGQYHAPFKLSASGATVVLLDKRGNTADVVTTPALARDQVYCRDADGQWQVSGLPTPGEANKIEDVSADGEDEVRVVPGAVEISEVMSRNATFFPDENGEHPDYIEVRNTTQQPVNLEGWALSDSRGRLMRWKFPAVTLPAGGCLAVHCSGVDKRDDPKHLHAGFKLDRDGEEVFFSPGDNNRIAGWMQVHYRLAFDENGYPRLYVFSNCRAFIRTIPLLCYDAHAAEDLDTAMEDHVADETRYFCMSRPVRALRAKVEPPFALDPLKTKEELNGREHKPAPRRQGASGGADAHPAAL